MRIVKTIIAVVFFGLCVSSVSMASPEESFHKGNVLGSSGWDFGYDADEEERKLDLEKDKKENEQKQSKGSDDFFNRDVSVYDRGISRTNKEEQKLKGRGLRKSRY